MTNIHELHSRNTESINDLKLHLLPGDGRGLDSIGIQIWQKSYEMWHETWQAAYVELNEEGPLFSDDFTRSQKFLSVFDKDECVMLLLFREHDLSCQAFQRDSYFKCWDKSDLKALTKYSNQITIGYQFTVGIKYRGQYKGISTKKLLTALSTCYLMDSDCSAMTGTMRNAKGMNQATFEVGADLIRPNVLLHGVEVDLVAFYKQKISQLNFPYKDMAMNLWNNRCDWTLYQPLTTHDQAVETKKAA